MPFPFFSDFVKGGEKKKKKGKGEPRAPPFTISAIPLEATAREGRKDYRGVPYYPPFQLNMLIGRKKKTGTCECID